MIFQRINRSDPEKIFIVAYNNYSTAALTNGQAVRWDFISSSAQNGVGVTKPNATATDAGFSFAGIVAETIPITGYGLIQVWGYHSATLCRTGSTSASAKFTGKVPIAAGVPLVMASQITTAGAAATQFVLESLSMAEDTLIKFPAGFAYEANAEWTAAAIAVFIKAL